MNWMFRRHSKAGRSIQTLHSLPSIAYSLVCLVKVIYSTCVLAAPSLVNLCIPLLFLCITCSRSACRVFERDVIVSACLRHMKPGKDRPRDRIRYVPARKISRASPVVLSLRQILLDPLSQRTSARRVLTSVKVAIGDDPGSPILGSLLVLSTKGFEFGLEQEGDVFSHTDTMKSGWRANQYG